MLDREEIVRLTHEHGGDWGVKHSERLLHLASILADGREYDAESLWLAAYLHDWGGWQAWAKPGVEHYDRSVEVAREFLTDRGCPKPLMELVLECIAFHHGGSPDRSFESVLLTDADALDLLGIVGAARTFAMNPRDIRGGFEWVKRWRDRCTAAITLAKTLELAAKRIEETDRFIAAFEEETFGIF
jgi:uncharacterized protein